METIRSLFAIFAFTSRYSLEFLVLKVPVLLNLPYTFLNATDCFDINKVEGFQTFEEPQYLYCWHEQSQSSSRGVVAGGLSVASSLFFVSTCLLRTYRSMASVVRFSLSMASRVWFTSVWNCTINACACTTTHAGKSWKSISLLFGSWQDEGRGHKTHFQLANRQSTNILTVKMESHDSDDMVR